MAQVTAPYTQDAVPVPRSERAWNRASWLVLLLALSMMLVSAAQKAYRVTLPTDGWAPAVGPHNLVFERNVLGLPSPIRAGDELLAVDGQDVTDWMRRGLLGQLPHSIPWDVGETVRYTVRREGQTLDLAIPLHRWEWRLIWRNALEAVAQVAPLVLLGFWVFWKRPGNRAARLLLLFGAAQGVILLNWFDKLPPGIETPLASAPLFWVATICNDDIHDKIVLPLSLYLALTFPVLSPPVRRFPRATVATLIGVPLLLHVLFFFGLAVVPSLAWFVGSFGAVFAVIIYNWLSVREPVARAQVRWVGVGYAYATASFVTAVLGFVGIIPRAWDGWTFPLGDVVLFATLAIAILRYHLFDIDIILNRALVYATLTALVIGVYIGIVGYASRLLHLQNTLVPPLIVTGIVAVLFQPLRERVQRGVNRLMYGERDEPYAALARLGQRLESALAIDDLLPTIAETVARTLKLPYTAIYLPHGSTLMCAAEYRDPQSSSTSHTVTYTLPLMAQGESVGELRLASRPGEHEWSIADQRLLNDLSRQAGIAVQAARLTNDLRHLTADLQQSRERLVTAREEERRRLRRDLHDGLGPALASLTLKVDAARNLLHREPGKADVLLAGVADQMQTTIADIRRLVYDLRPPALDQLGLVPALRQYLARLDTRTKMLVQAPDHLPTLPAAVEVAAYRIVLEAITNVLRHADAQQCVVSITLSDAALIVDVCDDGRGLSTQRHVGVGLRSMHERAAELGGACVMDALPAGGTQVRAQLPLVAFSQQQRGQTYDSYSYRR